MKAFNESCRIQFRQAGLILLLTEKFGIDGRVSAALTGRRSAASLPSKPRRAQPNRYPDLGLCILAPAFPAAEAASGPGEFVARYSGATVPDFHGVPGHLAAMADAISIRVVKEPPCVRSSTQKCQDKNAGLRGR